MSDTEDAGRERGEDLRTVAPGTWGVVTIDTTLTVDCPYDHIEDEYEVKVEYRPAEDAVEYQSLAVYLSDFEGVKISQEALTEGIYESLSDALDPLDLTVTVRGEHYGLQTEVRRS